MYSHEFWAVLHKMFKSSGKKKSTGFVMIYTIFITTICFILVQAIFVLEFKHKVNSENRIKYVREFKPCEQSREAIFTKLDEYIHINVKNNKEESINNEDVKNYFLNKKSFKLKYEGSLENNKNEKVSLEYDKEKDTFLVIYFIKGEFYKKERYSYKVKGQNLLYGIIWYSFDEEEKT